MASFTSSNNLVCHRCRKISGTTDPDSQGHVCLANRDLYVIRNFDLVEMFNDPSQVVGGFILPKAFVEEKFTNFPCPVEYIETSTRKYFKIGHGCAESGPFYLYLRPNGNLSVSYYKLNGVRIDSRNIGVVQRFSVYFNRHVRPAQVPAVNPGGVQVPVDPDF